MRYVLHILVNCDEHLTTTLPVLVLHTLFSEKREPISFWT